MGHAIDEKPFPRGVLIAAALLISFSIGIAATARLTGAGVSRPVPSDIVQEKLLKLSVESDGSVRARDAATDQEVAHLPQKNYGFIGVVLQGIRRERMRAGVAEDGPLHLTRHADGRLRIEDPSTGQAVGLGAFGHDNEQAFAVLIDAGRTTP